MQNQWFARHITFVAGFLACSLPVIHGTAAPQVLFEQMPGTGSIAGYFSNGPDESGNPGVRTADDLQFLSHSLVTRLEWWGYASTGDATDFTFTFYEDSQMKPGSAIHFTRGSLETNLVNVGVTTDPKPQYASTLDVPFIASPNQRYWLSIFNASPGVNWGWLKADTTTNGSKQLFTTSATWGPSFFEGDLSMRLIGIPEPSAASIASLAVIVVLPIFRRR